MCQLSRYVKARPASYRVSPVLCSAAVPYLVELSSPTCFPKLGRYMYPTSKHRPSFAATGALVRPRVPRLPIQIYSNRQRGHANRGKRSELVYTLASKPSGLQGRGGLSLLVTMALLGGCRKGRPPYGELAFRDQGQGRKREPAGLYMNEHWVDRKLLRPRRPD